MKHTLLLTLCCLALSVGCSQNASNNKKSTAPENGSAKKSSANINTSSTVAEESGASPDLTVSAPVVDGDAVSGEGAIEVAAVPREPVIVAEGAESEPEPEITSWPLQADCTLEISYLDLAEESRRAMHKDEKINAFMEMIPKDDGGWNEVLLKSRVFNVEVQLGLSFSNKDYSENVSKEKKQFLSIQYAVDGVIQTSARLFKTGDHEDLALNSRITLENPVLEQAVKDYRAENNIPDEEGLGINTMDLIKLKFPGTTKMIMSSGIDCTNMSFERQPRLGGF